MPNQKCEEDATINLIQITDCHLMKSSDGKLLGVNTRESLDAVISLVKQNIASNVHASPDYILATGDLAQDASPEAYHYFKAKMDGFACPVRWLPGNHDDIDVMRQVLGSGPELDKCILAGNWQIIMLDSLVKSSVHGALAEQELSFLNDSLQENPKLHSLICLHHHPIDINSVWLDKIGLHNRDKFFEILDRYDHVKAVLWGHIHQELEEKRSGFELLASPSTCIQFLPKSDDFAVDQIAPGYRWLQLHANGELASGVIRADEFEFELDLASNGY